MRRLAPLLWLLLAAACASNQAPVNDGAWFVYAGPSDRVRVDLFVEDTGYKMRQDGVVVGRLGVDLDRAGEVRARVPLPLWLRPAWREPGADTSSGRVAGRVDLEGRQLLVLEGPGGLRQYYHPLTGFLLGWEKDGRRVLLERSNTTQF